VVGGTGSATPHDAITIKYSRRGNLRWSRIYDRPEGEHNVGVAVAIDPTGWITVAGHTGHPFLDLLTVHYGP
jgi:hypothetical protein